jgi:putative alpha-1,2-mannosidase
MTIFPLMYLSLSLLLQKIVFCVLNPEEFPNLLAGSFTDGNRLSTGNTLPLVGRPWGFNHWSPQTRDANRYTGSWWFNGNDYHFTWMRCTHQPSPWIGDWGDFIFSPQIGDISRSPSYNWQPRGATIKPYLFDAFLSPLNLRLELTPTDHAAVVRVTFPATTEWGNKHVCFGNLHWKDHGTTTTSSSSEGAGLFGGGKEKRFLYGISTSVHSDRMMVGKFSFHVKVESGEASDVFPMDDLMCFKFKKEATIVHLRIATSLISSNQVDTNMRREVPYSKSFDQILYETKTVWRQLMRRVNVIDGAVLPVSSSLETIDEEETGSRKESSGSLNEKSTRYLTIFYTGLYRALTFPRRIDEIDETGKIIHYSPYDIHGRTFPGPLVTDNGFWDTYRTVYPLLTLLYPDHLGTIIQGGSLHLLLSMVISFLSLFLNRMVECL